jgi:isopenicillin N synthase-like dioxygenase
MSFNLIPAFSMSDIQKRDAKTIAELKSALTTHGFFTITDHGIADDVLQSSYGLSKDFFSLPESIKNTYALLKRLEQEAIHHLEKKLLLVKRLRILRSFGIMDR